MARDIGDDRAMSMDPLRRKRRRNWPWIMVVLIMVAGAFGLLPRNSDFSLERSCDTPAFVLNKYDVEPGEGVSVKFTGPDADQYVLVAGEGEVTGDGADVEVSGGGMALTSVFSLINCEAREGFTAPQDTGNYTIRLLRRTPGGFEETANSVALTVTR